MTKKLFFDTDCISSFLWIKKENILLNLYPNRIILPMQVFKELSNPSIPHISRKINKLCFAGSISTKEIIINTKEYEIYYELAVSLPKGEKIIGKGEAAAIALAKTYKGIIASNNFKDIHKYVDKFHIEHISAGNILITALREKYINEDEANQMWKEMLAKKRFLLTATFSDYIELFK